jgi:glycosyltransferase involved in cell wall biosynthesis
MILVYMPVYNEARDIKNTINSVLNQTYTNFKLIISDNHSNDGTKEIIQLAMENDPRIHLVSPPSHCTSSEHGEFLNNSILINENFNKYTIFIGGHDTWDNNLLEVLFRRAENERNAGIIYTESSEIDETDNLIRKYSGIIQVQEINRAFSTHHVLLGLTHNIVWGGLWREDLRRKINIRHKCTGVDHFMIAEMALLGDIIYQSGSCVYLRQAPGHAEGYKGYASKHIPKHIRDIPIQDFINQIEWASSLIDRAVLFDYFSQQPAAKNLLKSSLVSAYICRYVAHLTAIDGAYDAFFSNKNVQAIISSSNLSATLIENLLESA